MISSILVPQFAKSAASTDTSASAAGDSSSKSAIDFAKYLGALLTPNSAGQVSEEELFSGLVGERIAALKGTDAGEQYKAALDGIIASTKHADGFVPYEAAALAALRQVTNAGVLSEDEANTVYSQAFQAAQIDGDADSLYDDRGGGADKTIAVAALDEALKSSQGIVDQIESGALTATARTLAKAYPTGGSTSRILDSSSYTGKTETITPRGTVMDGSDGFLFKPISSNEKRLAVLLGAQVTGHVLSVNLIDQNGETVERGTLNSYGIKETGREKWTFSKQGGQYPKALTVEVRFDDGTIKSYEIPDPSKRYD